MSKEDAERRMQHAQTPKCQGQVFRCSKDGAASIWSVGVQKLPPELLKFTYIVRASGWPDCRVYLYTGMQVLNTEFGKLIYSGCIYVDLTSPGVDIRGS